MAYDDLYPEGTSTATVDVTMQRNENRPRWQHETPLRVTIRETVPNGFVVTDKPRAADQDGVSAARAMLRRGADGRHFGSSCDSREMCR